MGDAGLAAFPAVEAETGVNAFRQLRADGRAWLAEHGWQCRTIVKLHLGPVAVGRVGSPGEEILDVYGKTVNVAASLDSTGLAMTPAVFRSLPAEARTRFRKHTPPITYIDAEDRRPK
jgi:class 3 adenylate cyclase